MAKIDNCLIRGKEAKESIRNPKREVKKAIKIEFFIPF
jgi:hypothetical protein